VFEVLVTDTYADWYEDLPAKDQTAIDARVELLAEHGPSLGRPTVDTLEHSSIANLKELRSSTIRILFAFDPDRAAVLLLGGDKQGKWSAWYKTAIPEAERLWEEHLNTLDTDD